VPHTDHHSWLHRGLSAASRPNVPCARQVAASALKQKKRVLTVAPGLGSGDAASGDAASGSADASSGADAFGDYGSGSGSSGKAEAGSGSSGMAEAVVTTSFVVSGNVDDYESDPIKQSQIKAVLANATGVLASAVNLTFASASVLITAYIQLTSESEATQAVNTLAAGILASKESLTDAFASAGLQGILVENIVSMPFIGAAPSSSPPASPPSAPTPSSPTPSSPTPPATPPPPSSPPLPPLTPPTPLSPPLPPLAPPGSGSKSDDVNRAAIIGGVAGAIALIVAYCLFCMYRHRPSSARAKKTASVRPGPMLVSGADGGHRARVAIAPAGE